MKNLWNAQEISDFAIKGRTLSSSPASKIPNSQFLNFDVEFGLYSVKNIH